MGTAFSVVVGAFLGRRTGPKVIFAMKAGQLCTQKARPCARTRSRTTTPGRVQRHLKRASGKFNFPEPVQALVAVLEPAESAPDIRRHEMQYEMIVIATVFLGLSGCASFAVPAYSARAAQPGSYACQFEQYERVSD